MPREGQLCICFRSRLHYWKDGATGVMSISNMQLKRLLKAKETAKTQVYF